MPCDHLLLSPKKINTSSREMVRWINKMIMKGKIHWSLNKISQLILKKLTWTSVWRTCKGILGIKGLKRRGQKYDFQNPGPWGNRFSNLFRWKWKCTQRYTPLIKRLALVELIHAYCTLCKRNYLPKCHFMHSMTSSLLNIMQFSLCISNTETRIYIFHISLPELGKDNCTQCQFPYCPWCT